MSNELLDAEVAEVETTEIPVTAAAEKFEVRGAVKSASNFTIELSQITKESNPRDVFPVLTGVQGRKFIDLIKMAISPDDDQRAEFVRLVEEFENEEREDGKDRVTELAGSIRNYGQLQSIAVRKGGTHKKKLKVGKKVKNILQTNYRLIYGGRRLAAIAYNHAKHGTAATVEATIPKCSSLEELYELQVEENSHRLDFDNLEWGQVIHIFHTDGNLNYQQIADKIHKPYQFVRGRHALAKAKTSDPKLIERLEKGDITLTNAIRTALGEKTDTDKKPRESRQRPLTIKQMQDMFDQTSRDNDERLETLAQCMQVNIDDEIVASDARIAEAKAKAAKKAGGTQEIDEAA